jgi:peptidoglycan/LPS O-acetylase OafA/YrhL
VRPSRIGQTPELGSLKRLACLDGLRGIAILLVMLVHFGRGTHTNPVAHLLFKAAGAGWVGVDLFFVLSGFLITRILLSTRGNPRYFVDFYGRRVLRIFPLYYGVLTVALVLAPLIVGGNLPLEHPSQAWLWSYTSNVYPALRGEWFVMPNLLGLNLGHFWSLAVEEQFYLIWPFLVWRLSPQKLMWLCGALAITSISLRLWFVADGLSPNAIYCFTPFRMDGLVTGAWIAVASFRGARWERATPRAAALASVCLATLVGSMLATSDTFWTNRLMQTFGYSLLAILFGAAIVLAIAAPPTSLRRRLLESGFLAFFGKYSYGLYVFHGLLWPILIDGALSIDPWTAGLHSYLARILLRGLAASAISVGIAYASWHLFERPFLKLKRHFDYHPELQLAPTSTRRGGSASSTGPFD